MTKKNAKAPAEKWGKHIHRQMQQKFYLSMRVKNSTKATLKTWLSEVGAIGILNC